MCIKNMFVLPAHTPQSDPCPGGLGSGAGIKGPGPEAGWRGDASDGAAPRGDAACGGDNRRSQSDNERCGGLSPTPNV